MKEDIIIYVNSKTSMIDKNQSVIGISNENIVSNIIFKFEDGFVDGTARLELIKPDETKGMILMNKEDESYTLPIKSSLLDQEGKLYLQLRITKEKEGEEIPIFKSKMFYLVVNESINAEEEIPEQYPTWIEIFDEKIAEINSKIEEVDNIDISQERVEDGVEITITSKDGSSTIEKVYDGEKGEQGIQGIDGKDAVINGVNTLNIIEGEGIELEQVGYTLKITSTGVYDDTEIRQEIDEIQEEVAQLDRDITNVDNRVIALGEELQDQELTLNHLDDVKADRTEIPDVSEFVKKTVNDLTNYYLKSETYTQSEVNQLIGAIKSVSFKLVPELPSTGETNIIYLVPSSKSTVGNIYDEYIYVSDKFELVGSTAMDLSDYYTKDEINQLLFDYITSNDLEDILENYVKNTDYATTSKAGIVKVGNNLTVDEDGTLNAEAGVEKDDITIVENELGQIQAHGVIEQNNGNASKTWIGTQAEYENLSTKDLDTLYYITDGEDLYVTDDYLQTIRNAYIKEGLVNNTINLTDEEQIKIETWLGLAHNYLTYYNETPYQVNSDYIPAHKKYVDDAIKNSITSELESDF